MTRTLQITVLTAVNPRVRHAKTFGPEGLRKKKSKPDSHYQATVHALPATIPALAEFLGGLMHAPRKTLVHGRPVPGAPKIIRRRLVANGGQLAAVPSDLLILDIDGLPYPPGLDTRTDPEGAARYVLAVVAQYCPILGQTRCIVMPSNSAGQPGNLQLAKLHIFYILEKPALPGSSEAGRKKGLRHGLIARINHAYQNDPQYPPGDRAKPLIDPAVFNAVQPINIALPVFEDGAEDPIPESQRLMILEGEKERLILSPEAELPFKPPQPALPNPPVQKFSSHRPPRPLLPGDFQGTFTQRLAAIEAGLPEGTSDSEIFKTLLAGVAERTGSHTLEDDALIEAVAATVRTALEAAPPEGRFEERLSKYSLSELCRQARNATRYLEAAETLPDPGQLTPRDIDEFTQLHQRWLLSLPRKPGWDAVQSPMGTGKTEQIKRLIEAYGPQARTLVLVHRRSLAWASAERLGLACYLDKGVNPQSENRLVLCINSLHRLGYRNRFFDLVIIEESEQLLRQLAHLKAKDRVRAKI